MTRLSPAEVLAQVSAAMPVHCRQNVVIIGSLAAGYHFFRESDSAFVRTKDVDCVLEPFHTAVGAGGDIARSLLDAGWHRKVVGEHSTPGDESTPVERLPAIRLYPPWAPQEADHSWFIELLSVPDPASRGDKCWTRLPLHEGHFGLPSFRFLSLLAYEPMRAPRIDLLHARPELMALANLLEHPEIRPARMSGHFQGRAIKRSNKDLGRVISLAVLADFDDYRPWAFRWKTALENCFRNDWRPLARRAGIGLRSILRSPNDLDEAHHSCVYGLLASNPPDLTAFRLMGERVIGDAVTSLERLAES